MIMSVIEKRNLDVGPLGFLFELLMMVGSKPVEAK